MFYDRVPGLLINFQPKGENMRGCKARFLRQLAYSRFPRMISTLRPLSKNRIIRWFQAKWRSIRGTLVDKTPREKFRAYIIRNGGIVNVGPRSEYQRNKSAYLSLNGKERSL